MSGIDELTIGQAKQRIAEADELRKVLGMSIPAAPNAAGACDEYWEIGKNYFLRTVTHHVVGKLKAINPYEIVLIDAAWVADDGRFGECLEKGIVKEVEPAPEGIALIGRGSLIDAYTWNHDLLREVK